VVLVIVSAICGLFNGVIISVFKVQPFLVTMGTMNIYRGTEYVISNARVVRGLPVEFTDFMSSTNSTLPIPVIILLTVAVVTILSVKYTKYGRYIFAIGGNEEAARLSGINVILMRIITYVLVGVISGIAAIIYLGRLASVDANAGSGYELEAIAAAAIGGASLSGGKGSILGTILGALILAILANGLTLLSIKSFYQVIATGVIIIIAVLIDRISDK
jgi:ribose transport system permease protein